MKRGKVKYKKAPQAPRRFKSAYMFFSTTKHKEIREELGEKGESQKTTAIAKLVSKAWKDLTPQEREPWDEMARKDKARFEVEKTLYTGPWKIPAKKKSQKDPNAPKRPMSAFLSYSHSKRAEVKAKNPEMNNAEISRVLAQMWKDATDEEKKEYIDQEFELRQKYLTDIAEWREATEKEIADQRRHREEMALKALEARGAGGDPMQGILAAAQEEGSDPPQHQQQQQTFHHHSPEGTDFNVATAAPLESSGGGYAYPPPQMRGGYLSGNPLEYPQYPPPAAYPHQMIHPPSPYGHYQSVGSEQHAQQQQQQRGGGGGGGLGESPYRYGSGHPTAHLPLYHQSSYYSPYSSSQQHSHHSPDAAAHHAVTGYRPPAAVASGGTAGTSPAREERASMPPPYYYPHAAASNPEDSYPYHSAYYPGLYPTQQNRNVRSDHPPYSESGMNAASSHEVQGGRSPREYNAEAPNNYNVQETETREQRMVDRGEGDTTES